MKYNLIKADEARELMEDEHYKFVYLNYMKKIDERITCAAKEQGVNGVLALAPVDLIKEKVITELTEAGYKVKEMKNSIPEVNSISIEW